MFVCIYIPNASGDSHAALVDCAGTFSPRVENTSAGTVVFDVEGLERLFGSYSEIAAKVADEVHARGLEAHVAVASNSDSAICAARGFGGITVLNNGTEAKRLAHLPLTVLSPSPEILETLDRWGIRTLGAFAKLPEADVTSRLGQDGVRLHKRARGAASRPLVPHVDPVRFVAVMELDYEIETIEPLTFILSRMLDNICTRLKSRNLATHEIRLSLGTFGRVLNLPLPVRNPKILTKLLILDLEAHPPGAPVRRVEVEAIPTKPRVVQNGLFVPLSPEPEKLELTLARLKAVVGEENVGAAEIADTHRPDAFRVQKFSAMNSPPKLGGGPSAARRGGSLNDTFRYGTTPALRATPPNLGGEFSIALRLFRPPLEATVQLQNGVPIWIGFHGVHGRITSSSGPWHTSGDWWRPTMWDREEWDIEIGDALYRIYYDVHMDRWYAEGVYD
jgi:protein ImuB